jgi:SAM-dependent methyltransferase
MVAFVADKTRRLGEEAKVTAEVRDASDLSAYADSSFDAAFCMFGLMMVPDKEKAVQELHRVVKKGGKVVVATWASFQRSQLHAVLMNCMKRAAAARTEQPQPPAAISSTAVGSMSLANIPLSSEEQCAALFSTVPFSSVAITALPLPSRAYHGPVDFWQSCKGSSPMFIKGQTAQEQSAMDDAVVSWLGQVMGEHAVFNLYATSLITVAVK